MAQVILTFIAVILFAVSFRGFLASLSQNIRLEALGGEYSLRALHLGRSYKIAAWGFLAVFFLVSLTYFLFHLILS